MSENSIVKQQPNTLIEYQGSIWNCKRCKPLPFNLGLGSEGEIYYPYGFGIEQPCWFEKFLDQ